MIRLAVARLWCCSNSFNPRRTRLADLHHHNWTEGPPALSQPGAPCPEFDGLAAFLSVHPDWEAGMLRCAAAPPGGPLAAEVFGAWLADVESALRPGRFDALYLSLHGACQAEGDPGADLTVLRRLRMAARRLPIVASFDSLANISDEMPLLLDGASALRGPDDGAAAACRALGLLEGILTRRFRPVGAVARVLAVVPPVQLRPVMASLWGGQLADNRIPLLDRSVFSGFPWCDNHWAGPSALVWADRDAGAAREAASELALQLARGHDDSAGQFLPPAAEALAQAAAQGRTLVLDPADDPAAGSLGDTPELLRALLAAGPAAAAFGVLADPRALAAAHAAGEGAEFTHPLGACLTPVYGRPVTARLRVGRLLPDMAVLQAGPVAILVANRPMAAEPALFEAAGIDLGSLHLLALKGGETARTTFSPLFPAALEAGCAGPSSPDLAALPFNYVPAARRSPGAAERYASDQQQSAGEAENRDKDRRTHAQQQWAQPLGPQGTKLRIQA
jgi:microcystin degradation protein MlrC